jgi:two-component system OmpR family sensor kinase
VTVWKRLPIRHRLTLAFAAGLVVLVAGLSAFVYARTGADLLDTVDAGLRSRAELLVADLQQHGPALVDVEPTLIESDEVFAQIADPADRVVQSTSTVSRHALLPARAIASIERARYFDRRIPGVDNVTRVLAVPAVTGHGRFVVMVGASLQDRLDELTQLAVSLTVGGLAATALICGGGWLLLAGALRPVERMRSQAAAITALDSRRRLSPPAGKDELSSLAATLNQMLDRIEAAVTAERQLVDWASHELRTPLGIQRMDLDLALTGPQTVPELRAALESMSAENTHLTRLTEDLLVLSRARHGALPIRRVNVPVDGLLAEASLRASQRDQAARVVVRSSAGQAFLDPVWLRHAVDNLIDNGVRHSPADGHVDVSATREGGAVLLTVEDSGPGFSEAALATAFQLPRPGGNGQPSAGLGLAVVRAIAEAHGGRVWAENSPDGGARVTISLPDRQGMSHGGTGP